MRTKAVIAAALALTASAASANRDSDWAEAASVREGECALSVTGNGRFFRIAASGLEPGSSGRFVLANGDMEPLDWRIRANGAGQFARYCLPFRWHRDGGTVAVSLDGGGCALRASFDWTRAAVTVG